MHIYTHIDTYRIRVFPIEVYLIQRVSGPHAVYDVRTG